MSQCQEADYCAMFPRAEDRWDLPRISRLCRQGRYSASCDDTSTLSSSSSLGSKNRRAGVSAVAAGAVDPRAELGLLALFLDLQRMIAQSKAFNACNAAFLPWRLADMLQCAVQRLKRVLAKQRGIACLQHSLEEDEYERAQQAQETQAVDL